MVLEKIEPEGCVRKIFVIGRHRSGTTWVTNILASHHKVFTPTHEAHRGQHESEFFSSLVPYCRQGKTSTDRMAIRSIFERSDFWHLLFPEEAPSLDIDRLGVLGYFEGALDEAARLRDCTHWVEKTPAEGAYVAGQLVKAILKCRVHVDGARVLILGLTFKKNCPDMRNTRVVDVVAALRDYGVHVDVHDPWVDTVDVQKEYWLALVTTPQPEAYNGVSWPWRMTATARQHAMP
jgi:hypothetical protein